MNMEHFKPIESGTQYPANIVVDWYWTSANGTFKHREIFYHDLEGAFEFCRELARDFQTSSVILRFGTNKQLELDCFTGRRQRLFLRRWKRRKRKAAVVCYSSELLYYL